MTHRMSVGKVSACPYPDAKRFCIPALGLKIAIEISVGGISKPARVCSADIPIIKIRAMPRRQGKLLRPQGKTPALLKYQKSLQRETEMGHRVTENPHNTEKKPLLTTS